MCTIFFFFLCTRFSSSRELRAFSTAPCVRCFRDFYFNGLLSVLFGRFADSGSRACSGFACTGDTYTCPSALRFVYVSAACITRCNSRCAARRTPGVRKVWRLHRSALSAAGRGRESERATSPRPASPPSWSEVEINTRQRELLRESLAFTSSSASIHTGFPTALLFPRLTLPSVLRRSTGVLLANATHCMHADRSSALRKKNPCIQKLYKLFFFVGFYSFDLCCF